MPIATFAAPLPPDRALACQAMSLALAEEQAEMQDAADFAETFALCFFQSGSVRFAVSRAMLDLDRSRADRGATGSIFDARRN